MLFYVGRLIPRWLALWGIIAVPFAVAGCLLVVFGVITADDTANTVLTLPLGVQEIPLAIWLIAKGTSPHVSAAG
ncbi:hypothetical protein GCM10009606_33120 [Nocardioides aquiterrae]|uniref:Uncharacterized protein n=1 Tax=Nocardioides aquiterrae TaxID=203799 RepID=A0ABN1UJL2_9ACTN